jgi:LysR family transcriptional regulator, regulator for metE and metH
MIERSHMEIIEALDRRGSLTKAAEELHLTQSALTHSIRKLEDLTGSTVWEKEGRGLRLTEAGELILQTAKRILPQLINAEDQLIQYGQGKKGKLTIGVECHPCFEWLIQIINLYLKQWPEIDLDVTGNYQFNGLDALLDHKVNMIVTPDFLPGDSIIHFDILDFELQLMTGCDHKLAARKYIKPEDLNKEILYTYPISKSRLDIFKLNINPVKHIPVEAAEIMVQLVAAGRGVSTFPDWLIKKYAQQFNVIGIPLTKERIEKKLYIVIRKEDENIPFIRNFVNLSRSL